MQERIFGIETEYSVACRRKDDRKFITEIEKGVGAALPLKKLFPLKRDAPDNLKELLFFPGSEGKTYWLGSNGARFYFDIQNPEYATPECSSPREALLHNAAGDLIVEELRQEAVRREMAGDDSLGLYDDIFIFKMNTLFRDDEVNRSVGLHENYLVSDELKPEVYPERSEAHPESWFKDFRDYIALFLSSRQIFDGAGGISPKREGGWEYVISQRIRFVESVFSDNMTGADIPRGLFNFRFSADENTLPYTRFHVTCGDHTMSPIGKYIAMAATHLALRAFEEGDFSKWKYRPNPDYFTRNLYVIASDPTLQATLIVYEGDAGKEISAVNLQKEFAEFVLKNIRTVNAEEREMLGAWSAMIDTLSRNPEDASRELDWLIKLNFLREHCGAALGSTKARFASALYHDISERGIYRRLLRGGLVKPFAAPAEITACRTTPPNTRAAFRSRYITARLQNRDREERTHPLEGWGIFRGADSLQVYFMNPFVATSPQCEDFLETLKRGAASPPAPGL